MLNNIVNLISKVSEQQVNKQETMKIFIANAGLLEFPVGLNLVDSLTRFLLCMSHY